MKIRNLMLALAGTALVFSACEKDPDPKVPTTDANIALATILPNPDGMTGAAYPVSYTHLTLPTNSLV